VSALMPRPSVQKSFANGYSLSAVVFEEPYDPDGSLYADHGLRHAVLDGEQYASTTPPELCETDYILVDPETKAEFEEMQKKGVMGSGNTNTAQQIQNFDLASWMAGKTDTPPRGESPAPQIQGKKRG
jgi:hypothetical protein